MEIALEKTRGTSSSLLMASKKFSELAAVKCNVAPSRRFSTHRLTMPELKFLFILLIFLAFFFFLLFSFLLETLLEWFGRGHKKKKSLKSWQLKQTTPLIFFFYFFLFLLLCFEWLCIMYTANFCLTIWRIFTRFFFFICLFAAPEGYKNNIYARKEKHLTVSFRFNCYANC